MYRFARWGLYLLVSLIVLLGAAYGVAQMYKPQLLSTINENLKKGITGDIHIGDLDFTIFNEFPSVTITLSDIYLRGPRYEIFRQDFLRAEKVYIHVQPLHLLRGVVNLQSITIKNAEVFIFVATNGYTNLDVFKKSDSTNTKQESFLSLDIKEVLLENTHIKFTDSVKQTAHAFIFNKTNVAINRSDISTRVEIKGPINFDGLTFNAKLGSYLLKKQADVDLLLSIDSTGKILTVLPSTLAFEKSKVGISGVVNMAPIGRLKLLIQADQLNYQEGLTIVTRALREKLEPYQFKEAINLTVLLEGPLAAGEPDVSLDFSSKENYLINGKLTVKNFTFTGSFSNHQDSTKENNDINSSLALKSFSGRVQGVPTEGSFVINNLEQPELELKSKNKLKLVELNSNTDTTRIKFLGGEAVSEITYKGKLNEYLDPTTTTFTGKLKGSMTMNNGSVLLIPQQKKMDQVNAQLQFTEKEMNLDKITLLINGNRLEMKGKVKGFIPFFFQPKKRGVANISIYSPKMDLSTLEKSKIKETVIKPIDSKKSIQDFVQLLTDKVEFTIDLKVDELVNGPFQCNDLKGKISLLNYQLKAEKVQMKIDGGTFKLDMKMTDIQKPMNHVDIKAELKNADIKRIFTSFNNFKQKTIKAENLSGKVSAELELSADVDDQFKIDTTTLKGKMDLIITNGKIIHFQPLENMSNFLFKKRDFTEVQFAEISSSIKIAQSSLDIKKMEIQSNVLTLFLEGRYSFKDSTDLSIQIPLSNLKRRDKTYTPENVGTHAKMGMSVYLHAHVKNGKTVIAYDPFKRHTRKKVL